MSLLLALVAASPIFGIATSGDGDSFEMNGRRVRLYGVDAPEFDQTCQRAGAAWACGQAAAEALSELVVGKDVRCVPQGTDQYERVLAKCTVGAIDVNRTMVATGYAVAFRRYSIEYVSAEDSAKANKRGIWAGTFTMPSDIRAADRSAADKRPMSSQRESAPPRRIIAHGTRVIRDKDYGCRIKGNRNRRGQWIYHVPGMPYYDRTRAEDIFCSEAEARAAGYRRAIVK